MTAYHEEIVYAPSEDQRWMAGVLMRPNEHSQRQVAIICVHGSPGACYFPTYIYLGRALAERGYFVLSGNNRAQDIASVDAPWPLNAQPETVAGARMGGSGWYRFEEVAHDVAGWIAYVVRQGVEQVVLFGHSTGVAWATHYQATRQDPHVVGLILASGADVVRGEDPARVKLAEDLVAEGKADALLPYVEGVPTIFALESAGNLMHWERLAAPFAAEGHTPWLASIRTPILATLGTTEFNPNLRELLEGTRARATQAPGFDIQVIDGADHFYTDREQELARVVLDWLDRLPAAQKVTRRHWWTRR
jgi:pimeloyl-ACP methyl ester carboxylesterase